MRPDDRLKLIATLACFAAVSACSGNTKPAGDWLAFSEINPGSTSNRALICDPEICTSATDYEPAIHFDVSADRLAEALRQLEPSADFQTMENGDIRARYVDVTLIMRFRDDVDVLIRPVGESASLLAAYSRSRVGKSDLGKNASRIEDLVNDLRAAVK